jgi:N utilization substance protein B
MSARRIARELAVIVMPQLPKSTEKLEALEIEELISRSVHMLRDYAKEALSETNAVLLKSMAKLNELEIEHPANADKIDDFLSVPVKTAELREQFVNLERALNLVAEALDIPEMALSTGRSEISLKCRHCGDFNTAYIERPKQTDVQEFLVRLVQTFLAHRKEIDEFIRNAKAKWQVERMVTIDRDILRMACVEALYMPDIPLNVCISEAVELCHRFADEKAAKFVNGILGDLSEQARYFRNTGGFKQDDVPAEIVEAP